MKTNQAIKPTMQSLFISLALLATALAAQAQSWTNRFNGTADLYDGAAAIACDGSGNVIVTGGSETIGGLLSDCVTMKYSASGVPLWTSRYGDLTNPSWGIATAMDAVGSTFVLVTTTENGFVNGYTTIKYSGAGVPLWTNTYYGEGETGPTTLVVDSLGNACVTGYSADTNGIGAFLTVKYSNSGSPVWTNRYTAPEGGCRANGIAVDEENNVIVSGYIYAPSVAYATIKYSPAGVALWTNLHSLNADGFMSGLAVGGTGDIFVTGSIFDSGSFSSGDILTIAYSSGGVPLWTNRFQGEAGFEDIVRAAAVDSQGNLIVTGYSWTGSSYDYLTIKYSGAGIPLWTNYYDGPASGDDIAMALKVDDSDNAFVTGGLDFDTVAYASGGSQLWSQRYDNGQTSVVSTKSL